MSGASSRSGKATTSASAATRGSPPRTFYAVSGISGVSKMNNIHWPLSAVNSKSTQSHPKQQLISCKLDLIMEQLPQEPPSGQRRKRARSPGALRLTPRFLGSGAQRNGPRSRVRRRGRGRTHGPETGQYNRVKILVARWPFGLEGLWVRYAAKFDPFLSLDCTLSPSNPTPIQGKEGIKLCDLATLVRNAHSM